MENAEKKRKLVLLVDDDEELLQFAGTILEEGGYRTITADSGKRALELARSAQPDLILMDLMMPGMSGFEAIQALRRENATRHVPVLVFTGRLEREKVMEARRLKVKAYIAKPLKHDILLDRVEKALRESSPPDPETPILTTRTPGRTVLSFHARLDYGFLQEFYSQANSVFLELIKKDDCVLDLVMLADMSQEEVSVLEKIIDRFQGMRLHVIAGRNMGAIVKHGGLDRKVEIFMSWEEFEDSLMLRDSSSS